MGLDHFVTIKRSVVQLQLAARKSHNGVKIPDQEGTYFMLEIFHKATNISQQHTEFFQVVLFLPVALA